MDFNINLVISSIKTHILEKESDVFEPFLVFFLLITTVYNKSYIIVMLNFIYTH